MEQLKSLGISESDIGTDIIESNEKKEVKEKITFEVITVDALKQDKAFKKLAKKQLKELESLRSKNQKEKSMLLKRRSAKDLVSKSGKIQDENGMTNDDSKKLKEMLERHRNLEQELFDQQDAVQTDTLMRLLDAAQAQQRKEVESALEKQFKEPYATQAKVSLETARSVQSDKNFNKKSQKARRLKEKNENNTKKFIQEREALQLEQDKERKRLSKFQQKQKEELSEEVSVNVSK